AIEEDGVTWVRIDRQLSMSQFQHLIDRFNIDPMYISDAINVEHFSKPELLDNGIFVILKHLHYLENDFLQSDHIAIFVLGNVLLTISNKRDLHLDGIAQRLIENIGRIRKKKA